MRSRVSGLGSKTCTTSTSLFAKNLHTWTLTKFQSHTVTFEVTCLYRPLCTTLILHKKSFQIQVYVQVYTIHSQYTYVWDISSHHYNTNTCMYMSCVRWAPNSLKHSLQSAFCDFLYSLWRTSSPRAEEDGITPPCLHTHARWQTRNCISEIHPTSPSAIK